MVPTHSTMKLWNGWGIRRFPSSHRKNCEERGRAFGGSWDFFKADEWGALTEYNRWVIYVSMMREFVPFNDDTIQKELDELPPKDAAKLVSLMGHYEQCGLEIHLLLKSMITTIGYIG